MNWELFFHIAAVALAFFAVVIGIPVAATQYHRFLFDPRFWVEAWTRHALKRKRLRFPLSWYGYELLHRDAAGEVWEMPTHRVRGAVRGVDYATQREKLAARQRVVRVRDTTTGKPYTLAVPMSAQTSVARGAVAWTFDLSTIDYTPTQES